MHIGSSFNQASRLLHCLLLQDARRQAQCGLLPARVLVERRLNKPGRQSTRKSRGPPNTKRKADARVRAARSDAH
eukprot:935140-Prymnesium_polylepis.1